MNRHSIGWFITFVALAVAVFVAAQYFTGYEAIGAATRLLWNALALVVNSFFRLFGGLLLVLARGVGLRRLSRLAMLLTGVGLGYAGSLILSDARLKRARGWRGKLKAAVTLARNRWQRLHLIWKLGIVALLIASQVYLHFLLIIFPIAFLVPVIRRLWVRIADRLFGGWYWRTFGEWHRAAVAALRSMPGFRHAIGATRLWRIRYLCAWRLWKYDARYRDRATNERVISFWEPLRLWWQSELDRYVGRPLLAGLPTRPQAPSTVASEPLPRAHRR